MPKITQLTSDTAPILTDVVAGTVTIADKVTGDI